MARRKDLKAVSLAWHAGGWRRPGCRASRRHRRGGLGSGASRRQHRVQEPAPGGELEAAGEAGAQLEVEEVA